MKILTQTFAVVALTIAGFSAQAISIFAPGDSILGGQQIGTDFVTGSAGFGANQWPGGEDPARLIDGVGQKYLNFGKELTGAIITPTFGASVATSLQLWTANDEVPRDPASYALYGTNGAIDAGSNAMAGFSLISSGALGLPDSRNGGGSSPLDGANSQTIAFSNSLGFSSYLLLFPSLKDSANANSMQLAEAQLFGTAAALPEPATLSLLLIGLAGMGMIRRRKSV